MVAAPIAASGRSRAITRLRLQRLLHDHAIQVMQLGSKIYFYSVEWDPSALLWEDSRGKVLADVADVAAGAEGCWGRLVHIRSYGQYRHRRFMCRGR